MDRLRGQWHDVLQDTVYERVMGYLLECVIRASMKPVLHESECISENAGSEIGRIFRTLQKAKTSVITSASLITSPQGSGISGEIEDKINKYVGSWRKFCALTDLLEYTLSDISEWLPRRKFAAFTGAEMVLTQY